MAKKMELSGTDRVMMSVLFPEKHDITTMTMVQDLRGRTKLSPEDMKQIELRGMGGKTLWNEEKADALLKEYDFSEAEITFLQERVELLNKEKQVPESLLSLCKKVREGGKEGGKK